MNCEQARKLFSEPVNLKTMTREQAIEQTQAAQHLLHCNACFKWSFQEMEKLSSQEKNVFLVMNRLLSMLDRELDQLEAKHRTGGGYWKCLRTRKRLIQSVLEIATLAPDWKKVDEELRNEFFKSKTPSC